MSITRTCLTSPSPSPSPSPSYLHKGLDEWSGSKNVVGNCYIRISRFAKLNSAFSGILNHRHRYRYSCLNSNNDLPFTAYGMSDSHNYSADQEDMAKKGDAQQERSWSTTNALALAPIVDRGLSWFTDKFNFESRGKAFFTVVGFCFSIAIIMFLIVTLLSA